MSRVLLLVVLPMLVPFIVYGLYVWFARRGQRATATGQDGPPEREAVPWSWMLGIGVCLAGAALLFFWQGSGVPPGTKLLPPAVVDGEVVPSRPVE